MFFKMVMQWSNKKKETDIAAAEALVISDQFYEANPGLANSGYLDYVKDDWSDSYWHAYVGQFVKPWLQITPLLGGINVPIYYYSIFNDIPEFLMARGFQSLPPKILQIPFWTLYQEAFQLLLLISSLHFHLRDDLEMAHIKGCAFEVTNHMSSNRRG